MSFQGPDPYGTPGGVDDAGRPQSPPDVRLAVTTTAVVSLLVNGELTLRDRSAIEQVVRVVGPGGVRMIPVITTYRSDTPVSGSGITITPIGNVSATATASGPARVALLASTHVQETAGTNGVETTLSITVDGTDVAWVTIPHMMAVNYETIVDLEVFAVDLVVGQTVGGRLEIAGGQPGGVSWTARHRAIMMAIFQ